MSNIVWGFWLAACLAVAMLQTSAAAEPETAPAATDDPATISVVPQSSEAEPEPPQIPEAAGATQLQEVVVTATKRAAPVRSIPATVNVLTGEKLEREGIQSIDQIVQQVPGVNLTDSGDGVSPKRVTIRGVSTAVGANPTAGTLFGDVPFTDVFLPKVQVDPNPFDMATVEVLKGPQGTLFGGSGLNGLIRYVPEAPELDRFRVKYYVQELSYRGNGDSAWNYGAAINVPLARDRAALRLMGFQRKTPGYIDDTNSGRRDINTAEQYGVRAMATWLPADEWKISLMAVTQHTTEDELAFADNTNGRLSRFGSPRASPSESRYALANLGIERSFGWGELISQTAYFDKQYELFADSSYAYRSEQPLLSAANFNQSHGLTQEIRAVSGPGDTRWSWLAGAFYYRNHVYDCTDAAALAGLPDLAVLPLLQPVLPALPALPGLPISLPGLLTGVLPGSCPENADKMRGQLVIGQVGGEVDLEERALFGEVTRKLGKYLKVTLGARGYWTRSGGRVTTAGVLYAPQTGGMRNVLDNTVGERGLSPRFSIAFAPTRDLRSYFTVSRGFRFGGPQIGASTPGTDVPETYKSDSLWNYELGLRTDWFHRSLRLDVSAYRIDWKNPQVYQRQEAISGLALGNYIDNVGGAAGKGVEMALRYVAPFLPGLSLDASAAWNRTVTTEPFTSGDGTVVPTGSAWPLSPRWQAASTLAYVQPVRNWLLGVSLRHLYLGEACGTIECPAQVFGYQQYDLNVFANTAGESYWPQLSLSLYNLRDERGISANVPRDAPSPSTVNYIAPRALVLRVSGNF